MLHEVPFSYGICQKLKDFVQDDVRHSFSHESAEANAQIFRVLRPSKLQPSQHMQRQNNPCWWYEAQKIDFSWETDLASQLDGPIDLVLWLDWLWHVWIFADILSGVREGSLQLPHQQCESAFSLAEGLRTMISMKIRYACLAGSAFLWLSKDLFVQLLQYEFAAFGCQNIYTEIDIRLSDSLQTSIASLTQISGTTWVVLSSCKSGMSKLQSALQLQGPARNLSFRCFDLCHSSGYPVIFCAAFQHLQAFK